MFQPCSKKCLHNIWYMFTQYLKTHLDYSWRHAYTMFEVIFVMFEDMIIPCLKLVYTMYEDIIQFFLLIFNTFQSIFTLCMNTYLHKDIQLMASLLNVWTHIHSKLIQLFLWIQIPNKIFLKCFKINQDISKGLKQYTVFSYFFLNYLEFLLV